MPMIQLPATGCSYPIWLLLPPVYSRSQSRTRLPIANIDALICKSGTLPTRGGRYSAIDSPDKHALEVHTQPVTPGRPLARPEIPPQGYGEITAFAASSCGCGRNYLSAEGW